MIARILCVALLGAFAALPALAGSQTTAATVTTTSGNCLEQNNFRATLTLDATGASANIGYCFGANCTAAIGTAGTTTLFSGTLDFWPLPAPHDAMCFVSASGSQPLTIRETTP